MSNLNDSMFQKNIVWIASYPKSGNTWFRAFLTALQLPTGNELNLNEMVTEGIYSSKHFIEQFLDLNPDYLSIEQIESFRKIALTHLVEKSVRKNFIKIHDAFTFSTKDRLPLIPDNLSMLAVYIIRNPLDIALSLANHFGESVDYVIDRFIANSAGFFGPATEGSTSAEQFRQPLGTWSMHVESWLLHPSFPVHFVKYEDLIEHPFEAFKTAITTIGLEVNDTQIMNAIEESRFEKLQKKEREQGFKESSVFSAGFFHKGQSGRWMHELTTEQIEKIKNANEPMMRKFGYW